MIELAKERGIQKGAKCICVGHGANIEGLETLKEEVRKEFDPEEIVTTEVGCTIGTHTGPGLLVIYYLRD